MLKKWMVGTTALIGMACIAEDIPIFCENAAVQSVFGRLYTPPILVRSKVEAELKTNNKAYRDKIIATHQHVVYVPYGSSPTPFLLQNAYDSTGGVHYYGSVAEGGDPWKSSNPYLEYRAYIPKPGYVVKVVPGVPYRNDVHTFTGNFQIWKLLRPLTPEETKEKPAMPASYYSSPFARTPPPTAENPHPAPELGAWPESSLDRAFSRSEIYFSVSNGAEELVIVPSDWKPTPTKP